MAIRHSTQQKLWGRSAVVQCIRSIQGHVAKANEALTRNDIEAVRDNLMHLSKNCHAAAENMDIYGLERKRIKAGLARLKKDADALLEATLAIPVTQVEKVAAKRKKART